jgi:inosose dehydratase
MSLDDTTQKEVHYSMNPPSRRDFLQILGLGALAGSLPHIGLFGQEKPSSPGKQPMPFHLGIASYSFRAFSLDQVIEMTKRLAIRRLTLKDMHLPLTSSDEEIKQALHKIRSAGLDLASCGVVYMNNDEDVDRAFHYARVAELDMIVGVPQPSLLRKAERAVKETGIALAIHNHGPTDERYPGPEDAYRLIEGMDKRMGLCIDVGHTQRLGLDPAEQAERFFDRLLDVHIKDVTRSDKEGTTVEMGRGVVDIPKLLVSLRKLKYPRTLHIEFEKDENDPLPGVAESAGYLRGVMAQMGRTQ